MASQDRREDPHWAQKKAHTVSVSRPVHPLLLLAMKEQARRDPCGLAWRGPSLLGGCFWSRKHHRGWPGWRGQGPNGWLFRERTPKARFLLLWRCHQQKDPPAQKTGKKTGPDTSFEEPGDKAGKGPQGGSHHPLSRHPFPLAGVQSLPPPWTPNDWPVRDPDEGCGGLSGAVLDFFEGVSLQDTVLAPQAYTLRKGSVLTPAPPASDARSPQDAGRRHLPRKVGLRRGRRSRAFYERRVFLSWVLLPVFTGGCCSAVTHRAHREHAAVQPKDLDATVEAAVLKAAPAGEEHVWGAPQEEPGGRVRWWMGLRGFCTRWWRRLRNTRNLTRTKSRRFWKEANLLQTWTPLKNLSLISSKNLRNRRCFKATAPYEKSLKCVENYLVKTEKEGQR